MGAWSLNHWNTRQAPPRPHSGWLEAAWRSCVGAGLWAGSRLCHCLPWPGGGLRGQTAPGVGSVGILHDPQRVSVVVSSFTQKFISQSPKASKQAADGNRQTCPSVCPIVLTVPLAPSAQCSCQELFTLQGWLTPTKRRQGSVCPGGRFPTITLPHLPAPKGGSFLSPWGLQKGSAQNLLLKDPPWGAAPGKVRLAEAEGREPILGVQVSTVLAECSLSEDPLCTGIFRYVGWNQLSQMPLLAPSAHLLSVPGILHGPHPTEHDGEPGPPECVR